MENIFKQIATNSLQMIFSEISLKNHENEQEPIQGAGILVQESNGKFKLSFLLGRLNTGNCHDIPRQSKYYDEDGYYIFNGIDDNGEHWTLETSALGIKYGEAESTVISYIAEISRILNLKKYKDKKNKITLYFDSRYEFPTNTRDYYRTTKNKKLYQTRFSREIRYRNKNINIQGIKFSEYWALSFEDLACSPNLELRILESLQFICGQHLELLGRDVYVNEQRKRILLPQKHLKSNAKFFPPLILKNYRPKDYDKSWKLFIAFLKYITSFPEDSFSPLGTEVNAAIGLDRAFYETSILILSVRIEGILNVLYPNLGKPNLRNRRKIDTMQNYIKKYHNAELRNRLLGTMSGMYKSRPKDKLRKLVKKGVINKAHYDAWDEMRNKSAHAVREKDDNWISYIRRQHFLLIDLYYRIIFDAIGYNDMYTNFNSGDYELVKYHRYKECPTSKCSRF